MDDFRNQNSRNIPKSRLSPPHLPNFKFINSFFSRKFKQFISVFVSISKAILFWDVLSGLKKVKNNILTNFNKFKIRKQQQQKQQQQKQQQQKQQQKKQDLRTKWIQNSYC